MALSRVVELFACVWLTILFILLVSPSAWSDISVTPSPEAVVVRVGDTPPITVQELDNAVQARLLGSFGSKDEALARSAVLKELIKERLAEGLVTEEVIAATPDLAQALDEARRQILLKYHLFRNVSVAPPTLEEIKAYIADNRDLFEERRTYHFTEIIISLPREVGTSALLGKIQDTVRVDSPTPESLRMLCDWLDGMEITYGYSKLWQSSEQISPELLKVLQDLDGSARKVKLEKTGSEYRVVVLHASFADPLDPYRSRLGVAQKLAREAWSKMADQVMADAMAKADITFYGDPLPGLDLPRGASPDADAVSPQAYPRLAMAGSVAAVLSGLAALLSFLREPKPEMVSYERHFLLRRLWWSLPVRVVLSVLLAGVIVAPLAPLLRRGVDQEMIVAAAGGALLAGVLIALVWWVPALRGLRERRWLAPILLALGQAALLVGLSLARV